MSEETDLIKERLDLAEVIGEYVTLKQVGHNFKGLCPFHQEKTPSFLVTPDRGIWHCFGCHEGGDLFSFIQKIEGLDFPATLKLLAERAGVTLKQTATPVNRDRRARLFELLQVTAKLYQEILRHPKIGQQARDYLASRGVKPATIELFQIGYAPHQWQTVQQFLQKKGFTIDEMKAAGLVAASQRGTYYDTFRGRIMFPIHDVQGRVVAFGGRIVPWHATGQEGKYVNSPETAVYEKRKTIYNLHRAKTAIRQHHVAIVVEGYLDVVMLVQSGIQNVVASSGTAFTADQIKQLKRFTSTLHFAFDADPAGQKAAIAATEGALQAQMRVATLTFPAGQDPADIALQQPAQLQTVLNQPQSLVSVLLKQLEAETDMSRRDQVFQTIISFIKRVQHPIQQGEMIQELAQQLHLSESTIHQELAKVKVEKPAAPEGSIEPGISTHLTAEQQLLGLLINEPAVRDILWPDLQPELFIDNKVKQLYKEMHTLALNQPDFFVMVATTVLEHISPESAPLAQAISVVVQEQRQVSDQSAVAEGQQLVRWLRKRALETQLRQLQVSLAAGDTHTATLQQFQQVAEELAKVSTQS